MSGSFGRNLGLVVALLLICAAGVITAGDRFASIDNTLTILRFASTIGVVSIGMTFVITGGGIDLSVGAVAAVASVVAALLSPLGLLVALPAGVAAGLLAGAVNAGLIVGAGLLTHRGWARIVAMIAVGLHAIGQVLSLGALPVWSLLMLALDTAILFALTAGWSKPAQVDPYAPHDEMQATASRQVPTLQSRP